MIAWLQMLGVALIAAGGLLTFITSLGMIRLGSLFSRMHAATKPQVVSLVIMCIGLSMVMQKPRVAATLVLVVVMQFVVAPISAHMLGRAVYRLGQVNREVVVVDEYAEDLERAEKLLAQQQAQQVEQDDNEQDDNEQDEPAADSAATAVAKPARSERRGD